MDWKIFDLLKVGAALAFLCLFGRMEGQELAVAGFQALPNDMTARSLEPVRDANGELTALIKVVTVESGFVFEGGSLGIVKADQKAGEWWVYIPGGARTITIRHPRLGVLRNYAYPVSIASGNVYELKLEHGVVETIIKPKEMLSEFVVVTSDPPGADLYLNDEPVGKTPFASEKPEGRYEWRLEHSLYLPTAGVFDLKAGEKVELNITLTPNFGSLRVSSVPESGADILLNGMKMSRSTPATLEELPTGQHTLTLSHQWYETTSQQVTVEAGALRDVSVTMKPTFAEVNVQAANDEEVFINGSSKGKGNYSTRLAPGVYNLEVRKTSHKSATKQLALKSGDKETVSLKPTPILSSLKLQSDPMGAEVFLNGQAYGTTPQIVRDLLVGTYELELRLPGFGSRRTVAEVKEGQTVEVIESLSSMGRIKVSADQEGVEVYLNSSYKGIAPQELLDLEPGSYTITCKKGGYDNFEQRVSVDAGDVKTVSAKMEILRGSIALYSTPSAAAVYLEGTYKGQTPLLIKGLDAQGHVLEFKKDGYNSQLKRVYIAQGESKTVTVDLAPNKATRLASRYDCGFMLYPYETGRGLGISFGSLNIKTVGAYINASMNVPVFYYSLYEIDAAGNSDSPWNLVPTGEIADGSVRISTGLTFRLAYPIWGYVGGGWFYERYLVEYEEYGSSGTNYGTEWYERTDRTQSSFAPEAGVMLRPGNTFVLKYGVAIQGGLVHQFGLGFQL